MKNENPGKSKPLSLSAFGKSLSPPMSCEGLRQKIASGRLTQGLVIVNGKPKVADVEAAARNLGRNSRSPRAYVPAMSQYTQVRKNSLADLREWTAPEQICEEMLDYCALATEFALLLFEGGTTEDELAAHCATLAGIDVPDNALEYVKELAQAADELAEERRAGK